MGKIIINSQEISFHQIRNSQWPEQAPYFQASLSFCREWLNGKDSFGLQSSGSTGTAKTIVVSRTQMSSSAKATGEFFDIQPEASLLCCLNTAMIAGKMMLVRAMEWDSLLYLVEPSSNPLADFSGDQRFDFATMVPLQLDTCLGHPHSAAMLQGIRSLLIGGAPLSEVVREKARKLPVNLFQTYGMTETVSHIALADLKAAGPLVYITLPGVQTRQSPDGRLEIKAPMSDHQWITTNDIVEIIPGKGFVWKGRSDFTINTGGVKVQPEEVEAMAGEAIERCFPGQRYFITSLPDRKLGQKVILVIEGKNDGTRDHEQVLKKLKAELPPYHCPKELHFVPEFSITASNKINRLITVKKWRTQEGSRH